MTQPSEALCLCACECCTCVSAAVSRCELCVSKNMILRQTPWGCMKVRRQPELTELPELAVRPEEVGARQV